jgi:hypothetical protein
VQHRLGTPGDVSYGRGCDPAAVVDAVGDGDDKVTPIGIRTPKQRQ